MLQLQNRKSSKGPLWLVEPKYTMGTNPDCDIVLSASEAASSGVFADLLINIDQVSIVNLGVTGIAVNGKAVTKQAVLKAGDSLEVGAVNFELIDPKKAKLRRQAEQGQKKPDPTKWSLKAMNTALAEKQFPINGSAVLGRSKDCDISLGVVHLSRHHARLTVESNGLKVEDMGSSNGTFVNGKKIQSSVLLTGDELSFDTLRFRVIGPEVDDDRTNVRPAHDAEMTTVRQALKVDKPAQSASAVKKAKPKHTSKSTSDVESAKSATHHEYADVKAIDPKAGGFSKIILIVIVLAIAAGAAWFLTK
ncbi:MAG: FHA domain-containing protein [Alteromonadaceae bacterium]|nr:MAG: FHA domain-containing protein [Alteromonadaceae bacterium]